MKKRYYLYILVMLLIDQLTKFLVIDKTITIIPDFLSIIYTQNYGGALGIGRLSPIIFLSIILIIGIIYFMNKCKGKIRNNIPFIMILTGSISNLFDRLFRGYVIDFIKFNIFDFPCFNFADIFIVIGIILLVIFLVLGKKEKEL